MPPGITDPATKEGVNDYMEDLNDGKLTMIDPEDIIEKVETVQLKQENYEDMKVLDPTKQLDPSLKIGTGDDELVDQIVGAAKTGLGVVGTFIPDKAVSNAVKQKPII
jgi:hypothetical protein